MGPKNKLSPRPPCFIEMPVPINESVQWVRCIDFSSFFTFFSLFHQFAATVQSETYHDKSL